MPDLTTTITVNGAEGGRFLSTVMRDGAPVPRALHELAATGSIEVDLAEAEQVARFIDELAGHAADPPLLFSPRVGDEVVVRGDVLAEVARAGPGLPLVWRFVEAGSLGKLIGWRDREDGSRAVIDLCGSERRLVVFVAERQVTRARRRS